MSSNAFLHRSHPRVFLLRHCRTEWDGQNRYVGQSDVPLSDRGREEAEALRHWFSAIPISRGIASDLMRSHETALAVTRARPFRVEIFRELREIGLGEWEGRTFEEIESIDPDRFKARSEDFIRHRPPGGENFDDLQNRVVPFFERLVDEIQGNILIVAHAWVNRVLLCRLLGMPLAGLASIGQDYGAINIISLQGGRCLIETINLSLELCRQPR
ncbi:MAG: histidine phosphatase family protein [Desulfobacteraceae bacterium]|nr:MAG: histidine phosphatase family protein [Desulfobacteraceae bacterium]